MEMLGKIKEIAIKARQEQVPVFDVSSTVLHEINSIEQEKENFIAFDMVAVISSAAASLITFLTLNAWFSIFNPVLRMFAPIQEIPLW